MSQVWLSHATLMGWLRVVGWLKLQVSFAKYRLFYRALLQKRPVFLRSLLIVATPYMYSYVYTLMCVCMSYFWLFVYVCSCLFSTCVGLFCMSLFHLYWSLLHVSFAFILALLHVSFAFILYVLFLIVCVCLFCCIWCIRLFLNFWMYVRHVQPIADGLEQNLERLFLKLCQHTKILPMGFTIRTNW